MPAEQLFLEEILWSVCLADCPSRRYMTLLGELSYQSASSCRNRLCKCMLVRGEADGKSPPLLAILNTTRIPNLFSEDCKLIYVALGFCWKITKQ